MAVRVRVLALRWMIWGSVAISAALGKLPCGQVAFALRAAFSCALLLPPAGFALRAAFSCALLLPPAGFALRAASICKGLFCACRRAGVNTPLSTSGSA